MKKLETKKYNSHVTMKDRWNWLREWIKMRDYDIGSRGEDFLFIYRCTMLAAGFSPEVINNLLHQMNSKFVKPLPEEKLQALSQRPNYPYKNTTIIRTLGITQEEEEILRIGHNLKESYEREKRKEKKERQLASIIALADSDYTTAEIEKVHPDISRRTIQRILSKHRESSMSESEKRIEASQILHLYQKYPDPKQIARQLCCPTDRVCRVLTAQGVTDFPRLEIKKVISEMSTYKNSECESFFTMSKTVSTQAGIDAHSAAMSAMCTYQKDIVILGAAGTGKSHLVNRFIEKLSPTELNSTLILAPTGRAADHLNGQTIHKMFELPICVLPDEEITAAPKILSSINTIIIDEINLVRIDVFTRVMKIIQYIEEKENRHIQLILLGDFGQIQPVATPSDLILLDEFFPNRKGLYAFHSELWEQRNFRKIILSHVYRQNDPEFLLHLSEIKYGKLSAVQWFNANTSPRYMSNAIHICPTNQTVDEYNQQALKKFKASQLIEYKAKTDNKNLNVELPCPETLLLAVGMRVMTICNDQHFKNGSMGTIVKLNQKSIVILFDHGNRVTVSRKKFILDDRSTYEQIPVVLAYAITANKSEGMTFDAINIEPGFFAPGQLYTALSRCRNHKKIFINGTLTEKDLLVDVDALRMTINEESI